MRLVQSVLKNACQIYQPHIQIARRYSRILAATMNEVSCENPLKVNSSRLKVNLNNGNSVSPVMKNGLSTSERLGSPPIKGGGSRELKYDLNSSSTRSEQNDDFDDVPLTARLQRVVENEQRHDNCKNQKAFNSSSIPALNKKVKLEQHSPTKFDEHLSKLDKKYVKSAPMSHEKADHQIKKIESLKKECKDSSSHKKVELKNSDKTRLDEGKHHDEDKMKHAHHRPKHDDKAHPEKKRLKIESDDEDLQPMKRVKVESDDDDDMPLSMRKKPDAEKEKSKRKVIKREESDDEKPQAKKKAKIMATPPSPTKGKTKKKVEEHHEVWKWWEEQNREDGIKWKFLEHKGPLFAPLYERLPSNIKFYYDGQPLLLSEVAEEVATFYSKMIGHDYVTKEQFNSNFFKDWRKIMTSKEREIITDLKKCDFKEMHAYFIKLSEERKNRSKEEKLAEKEKADAVQKEYGVAIIDGHKEKIGNFRIEPPGLFRGRGTHPKMGRLKRRVQPEDVTINCSKDSKIPTPPAGHKWKKVQHDNLVTWLASWNENIMGSIKYVMLNPSSKIKGEKDWQKYEVARRLKSKVDHIREQYVEDWKSKEMRIRQRAVALYFIDKLALRAGNEKEEGETADTVGCCSLRCEHIKLHEDLDGQEFVVEFDFLGKDSIRYYNRVPVEKRVFKNLKLFMEGKKPEDDLFDRLNTAILNKHLSSLMDGLSAKVFRTYNASFTLQQQLKLLTKDEMSPAEKLLSYNRANRQVAILCNHQRAVPKAHSKQMETLLEKITEKRKLVKIAKGELKDAKLGCKGSRPSEKNQKILEQKQKQYDRLKDQLQKLEVKQTDKEENKEIALGTSKLNYLDPRISVAWCKKWDVSIEKVYNKTQREKFRWAIDMADKEFKW